MRKKTTSIITAVVLLALLHPVQAADVEAKKIDVAKVLSLMDMIGLLDTTRPDFEFTPEKFTKDHSDMVGGFSDSAVKVEKGYYGITGGLERTIALEFTQPSILATYGGNNTVKVKVKTKSHLLVLVSGGTNKFEVEKSPGFAGTVQFVTQFTSTSTFKGGEVMSFQDYWRKHRK